MKRIFASLFVLLLLPVSALANSWGLRGDLLTAVMADSAWNDYTTMDQEGNVAAMTSRYHNALMLVMGRKEPLQVYTRALWQPDDDCGNARLTGSTAGFTLSYPETGEEYRFENRDGEYLLTEAFTGSLQLTLLEASGHYGASSGDQTGFWYGGYEGMTLDRFSIRLIPHSQEELTRLNLMRAVLDSGSDSLGWWTDSATPGILYTPGRKGTVPVYGAPSADAWRAGKGKAAVSLKGEIRVLREWTAADGVTWLHISYEVSQRTHRFGFIRASDLPGYKLTGSDMYRSISVPVQTAVATTLTDDPFCSQYAQATLPAGTRLTCIGMLNDEYAFVQTVLDGKEAWLFVPLKDLKPVTGMIEYGVMTQLDGCWEYWAGGSMGPEYLRLNADGTFYDPSWPATSGFWYVTSYDPARNLYWDNPPYEITLLYSDGRSNVRGLSLHQEDPTGDGVLRDGFSLTNREGGGGYIRINEEDVPLHEPESDGEGNG